MTRLSVGLTSLMYAWIGECSRNDEKSSWLIRSPSSALLCSEMSNTWWTINVSDRGAHTARFHDPWYSTSSSWGSPVILSIGALQNGHVLSLPAIAEKQVVPGAAPIARASLLPATIC